MVEEKYNMAYEGFFNWVQKQPDWIKDAIWNIYQGNPTNEQKIEEYVNMCINEVDQIKNAHKKIDSSNDIFENGITHMSILKIDKISNINALDTNARLKFNKEGLNVIYGLNGSGKSSFMRILKKVSGNTFKEEIKRNVYLNKSSGEQTCTISIDKDGEEKDILCKLNKDENDHLLKLIDVFDTKISYGYLTKENNVSYQPFIFNVLQEIAQIADSIKSSLTKKIQNISVTKIKIPEEFDNEVEIEWLKNINSKTIIPKEYLSWSSEQEEEIYNIQKKLDQENQQTMFDQALSDKRTINAFLNGVESFKEEYESEDIALLEKELIDTKEKMKIAQEAFSANANQIDKISIGSDVFKDFWNNALIYYNSFIKERMHYDFGEEYSICPLCHQVIQGENHIRVMDVNIYLNGKFNNDYSEAKQNIEKFSKRLLETITIKEDILLLLKDIFKKKEFDTISSFFENTNKELDEENVEILINNIKSIEYKKLLSIFENKLKDIDEKINQIVKFKDKEKVKEYDLKLKKLKLNKWVYLNKMEIEKIINNLYKIEKYENAKKFTTTNNITKQTNKLADILITETYIKRFTDEMKLLAPGLKVKLKKAKSKKGKTPYKVTVDNESGIKCNIEDILSEGEQRIVALATFFADASGRGDKTPIIIDDPISSLDINYERATTKRIVDLAKDRQVIVFTHRISLLVELMETSKNKAIPFEKIYIKSGMNGKGVLDYENKFFGKVRPRINELIDEVCHIRKNHDPDTRIYQALLNDICGTFRVCVEQAIELNLLSGVIRRYEKQIRTGNSLMKLSNITKKDCHLFDSMMAKYSADLHSQPTDSAPIVNDINEVEEDMRAFVQWIDEFNNRSEESG